MLPNPQPSDYPLAATREILLVGFEEGLERSIRNFPAQSRSFHSAMETNGFMAYRWLNEHVDDLSTFQLPYAVLCHIDWLIQDEFRLVQQMADHPDLCSVPFILFTEKDKSPDVKMLLSMGVDDSYSIPVAWQQLEHRLEFLNQHKPRFLEKKVDGFSDNFHLKIPFSKRMLDITGASLGIILSIWIWLPVMVAIWLETRGPVIYKSRRVGYGYQVFNFLKFRSMYDKAEE
jgi:DNA-binding response OmpR family regulator